MRESLTKKVFIFPLLRHLHMCFDYSV
jgi:hypothetical protein